MEGQDLPLSSNISVLYPFSSSNTTTCEDPKPVEKIISIGHDGVLSNSAILRELSNGRLVFVDPDRNTEQLLSQIGNCSIDFTLGKFYYRNAHPISFFNPWNNCHVKEYWGILQTAEKASEYNAYQLGLVPGQEFILLAPGESILGHTREFIGAKEKITFMVKARSSLGRCNLTVCRDAGWGDIGYINRVTLEITNNSSSPMVLPIGARLGQIVFFYTEGTNNPYKGKYQVSNDLAELIANWQPSDMLPKLYMDNL